MKEEKDFIKEHITSNFRKNVPSIDFTDLVMHKIEISLETKCVASPLISKKSWIYVGIIGLLILLVSFGVEVQQIESNWFSDLGFELPNLGRYKMTVTLGLGIVSILGLMTMADVLYRKRNQII